MTLPLDNSLTIMNSGEPTYLHSSGKHSHIDLTLISSKYAPRCSWKVHPDTSQSDHFPLLIDTDTPVPQICPITKWNLKEANWTEYEKSVCLPELYTTPTSACQQIIQSIQNSANQTLKRTPQYIHPKYTKPWWTPLCAQKKKEKNAAYRNYKKHLGNIEYWIQYKKAEAVERYTIKQAKTVAWQNYVSSITSETTSQEVFQKVRLMRGISSAKTITLSIANTNLTQPLEVANHLASNFANAAQATCQNDTFFEAHKAARERRPLTFNTSPSENYNKEFTMSELLAALHSRKNSSPGPDQLPYPLISHLPHSELTKLLLFYNYIWNSTLPCQWKHSIVVPILKPGKIATATSSFRPIALTNCLCKIMEKMINRRLQLFIEENGTLPPYQSGFRVGRSTLDNLTLLTSDIKEALTSKQYCIAIFLDIQKAFDTVWHHGLLEILKSMGLTGNLPYFLQQFIKDRQIQVRVNGTLSALHTVPTGVPQGSILSPTLFNLMVSKLFPANQGVHYSLYADDAAFWLVTPSLAAGLRTMQQVLDELAQWSHLSGLLFSPNKTKAMIFTNSRKPMPHPLSLNGQEIDYVTSHKFLGLTLDKRLTWQKHISNLIDKCQSDIRLLQTLSHTKWGANLSVLRKLYLAILRPKLEYGDFLFASAAPSLLKRLDRMQYQAARIILCALRCTPTKLLEAEAHLLPLPILREQNSTLYGVRILAQSSHPVGQAIRETPTQSITVPSKKPTYQSEFLKQLKSLPLSVHHISEIPPSAKLKIYPSYSFHSLLQHSKNDLNPNQWQNLLHFLIKSKYPNFQQIYCDGSVTETGAGSGVWSTEFSLISPLHPCASTITSELNAVYVALTALKKSCKPNNYLLLTDSLSSIILLQNPRKTTNYLPYKILNLISTFQYSTIVIEWVPSHMSINGNEQADALAKLATTLPRTNSPQLPLQDVKRIVKTHFTKQWQTSYSQSQNSLLLYKPHLSEPYYSALPRPQQVIYSRLRLNTTNLTHKHHFHQMQPPICPACHVRVTLPHVFLECPRWFSERSALIKFLTSKKRPLSMTNILACEETIPACMTFLMRTGLASLI